MTNEVPLYEMNNEQLDSAVESLLFIYGEPVSFAALAKILGVDAEKVEVAVLSLQNNLVHGKRGLRVVVRGKEAQLVTASEYAPLLKGVVKEEFSQFLSPASLETLSIIAYRGPLARSEIDYIRGVNSTFILRSLLIRGLVDRRENPKRLNTYLYTISFDLMRMLGLERIEDIPEYQKYNSLELSVHEPPQEQPQEPNKEIPSVHLPVDGSISEQSGQ
ncbi:MAG: SMC-Scp complex subunit ScpB [Parcubacteria group bacterium RIFCSPLOWO2_01_FULL_48_18]|nr:MAG: SMC-Scp complex subunit ScpB [Parcubacteria group bacterium RIFCSPLOWO2_01_FULL_48_18]